MVSVYNAGVINRVDAELVHVDLDNLSVYKKFLHPNTALAQANIYDQAVPNLLDIFRSTRTKSRLFVIGEDLEGNPENAIRALNLAISEGHEIGNHSYSHPSNFLNLDFEERRSEIRKTDDLIRTVLGFSAKSFRAPGYAGCWDNLQILRELEYNSDCSRLPAVYSTGLDMLFRVSGDKEKILPSFLRPNTWSWLLNSPENFTEIEQIRNFKGDIWSFPNSSTLLFKFPKMLARMKRSWKRSNTPFLFHAIDFIDCYEPNSKIPALNIPFLRRMKLISTLLE